ncbi:MAG: hypothetical protein M3X11_12870 [Acidobacteriota bacterium]|nr:hypothetical protein [Acidobacteriota bacterium]
MVWQKIYDLFKRLFTINDDLSRLQAELKRQGDQIREIVVNQTRFQYELQLQKERDAHEREQIKLQLENRLLRERLERLSLPPSTSKPLDESSTD